MTQYPAGKYYIGDLSYYKAINWDNFDKITRNSQESDITVNGINMWYHRTPHGDGLYTSNIHQDFSVDSGVIGICPIFDDTIEVSGGVVIDIHALFIPEYIDGTFVIDYIQIDTDHDKEFIYENWEFVYDDWGLD